MQIGLICPVPASNELSSPGILVLSEKRESDSIPFYIPATTPTSLPPSWLSATTSYWDGFETKTTTQALYLPIGPSINGGTSRVPRNIQRSVPHQSLYVFSRVLLPFLSIGILDCPHKRLLDMSSCNFRFQAPLIFPKIYIYPMHLHKHNPNFRR